MPTEPTSLQEIERWIEEQQEQCRLNQKLSTLMPSVSVRCLVISHGRALAALKRCIVGDDFFDDYETKDHHILAILKGETGDEKE